MSQQSTFRCRLCNAGPHECKGWLQRVNAKGEAGIFECRPMCGADLPQDERIQGAIEYKEKLN